jgi:hypothetical protein
VYTGGDIVLGQHRPSVGREVLLPLDKADVMATWADGSAAAIRHRYGKGTAWLIGTFAGLEYVTDVMADIRAPYPADRRSWVSGPMLDAGIRPVVDSESPRVEGILLRNRPDPSKLAVVLVNWGDDLKAPNTVRVRGVPATAKFRSAVLDAPLESKVDGDWVIVTLPSLSGGDVLVID